MNTPGLISDFQGFFSSQNPNKTIADHAQEVANAYDTFAKTVLAISGATLLSGGKSQMQSTIMQLATVTLGPASAAVYDAAATAYWAVALFNPLPPAPGLLSGVSVTHTPPTPGIITAMLTAAIADPSGVAAVKANLFASAFAASAATVTTTHTGPSAVFPFPVITVGPFPVS